MAFTIKKRRYQERQSPGSVTVRRPGASQTAHPENQFAARRYLLLAGLLLVSILAFFVLQPQLPSNLRTIDLNFLAQTRSPLPPAVADFELRTNTTTYLTYFDPEYKFSVKYPVGYVASSSTTGPERLTLQVTGPSGVPEFIRVIATNESFDDSQFKRMVSNIPKQSSGTTFNVTKTWTATIDGKRAYFVSLTQQSELIPGIYAELFAVVDCGAYRVAIESITPPDLAPDQQLAEYMTYSLRCN